MMFNHKNIMSMQIILALSVIYYSSLNFAATNSLQEIAAARSIVKAIDNNTLRPVPSVTWSDFDERQAYRVQKRVVANLSKQGKKIVAYKAGLTAEGAAKKFDLSEPIIGVLFEQGQLRELSSLSLNGSYRLLVEQELAFLLSADIHKKVADVASLKGHFSHVAPALEFPDVGFSSQPNGLDIIANNVVNRYFYHGQWLPIPTSINQLAVNLSCENQLISEGVSNTVMGDQWQALLWMVNHLYDLGYPLRKGHVLLTGNIGLMVPVKLCDYHADFSILGDVHFKVVP